MQNFKTSIEFFIVVMSVYVLFWQEMTSAHNEAVVHRRSVEGMPKAARPSTAKKSKTLGLNFDQLGS